MIEVIISFEVNPGELDNAKATIREFIRQIDLGEEGTLSYRSLQDKKNPCLFFHTMLFNNEKAHQYHRESSHCLEFVDKLYPLCIIKPSAHFVDHFESTVKI